MTDFERQMKINAATITGDAADHAAEASRVYRSMIISAAIRIAVDDGRDVVQKEDVAKAINSSFQAS